MAGFFVCGISVESHNNAETRIELKRYKNELMIMPKVSLTINFYSVPKKILKPHFIKTLDRPNIKTNEKVLSENFF